MARLRKAVITAAGRGTRMYPATHTVQKELTPLVDVDGFAKPTLQIIVEECLESGIEEVCIVANPHTVEFVKAHFQPPSSSERMSLAGKPALLELADKLAAMSDRIHFVVQQTQEGYGHAVYQARDWVGEEGFLTLLGDHVYVSSGPRCSRQAIDAFERLGAPVTTVAPTPEAIIHRFGTVKGVSVSCEPDVFKITRIVEKPSPELARNELRTPGLSSGEYLCHFGIHVFPAEMFDCLRYLIEHDIRQKDEIQLTAAQELLLANVDNYYALLLKGERYDMGVPEGFVETQVALALHSPYRKHVERVFAAMR